MKPIVREFMKATHPEFRSPSGEEQGLPQPPLELPLEPGAALIPLPAPGDLNIPEISLRTAIERRRTLRRYTSQPLTLEELSFLLWVTQGVKEITRRPVTLRTVPSAGARHAFETYLLANNVAGLEPGLYRFAACEHALARLQVGEERDICAEITHACMDQKQIHESAVTFLWVAVTARMAWRYTERGLRYMHLDAGHVCQNLYLGAEAVGCGVCAIDAYDDDLLNQALGLDGEEMFAIYLASLGKRGV